MANGARRAIASGRACRRKIEEKQHGAADYFVTLGEPLHHNVTGDTAYVVVPVTMTFKVHGQQVTQIGAIFTLALSQVAGGARNGVVWSKGASQLPGPGDPGIQTAHKSRTVLANQMSMVALRNLA
jgi:hypothetical protein